MLDKIDVLTHSSIKIRSDFATVYVDPFNIKEEAHDADYVFVTHDHYDHFSPKDIRKIIKDTTIIVCPYKMFEDAREFEREVKEIVAVKPSESYDIDSLEVETVPAYNTIKPFHPKRAEWVGYILKLDGKRIYIAGDTGLTKESKTVKCDIALVPIGGTYTMDAKRAAELINIIKPEAAIPTHYGAIVGKPADAKTFASNVQAPVQVVEKIQYYK
ncbi:MBL fold metallo-hydrolase [Butyrivibrio fibrisolvens]|uniref:MBL fold metallo-hydrolase n=1 Tax=Butyrivibrio fibrisolvens TaxID=831 RepID=UPI000417DEF5|nr:MBL fold metallo-hydrolase [Butyrivibrio fibrisolvens]